jgi:8-oxo-dGTP diphosphatase
MKEAEMILRIEKDIAWLPRPNEGQIILSSLLPPQELITTAFALAFAGERLLLTNLMKRGWDITGGHVEAGEVPEQAVRREVYEEAGAKLGPLHLLGYQRLRLLGPQPASYRYPYPTCYQVFYWAQVESWVDVVPTAEKRGRAFFSPLQAQAIGWVQRNRDLYKAALAAATG